MSAKDLLTTGAPFPPEQLSRLQQTLAQASPLQLAWLSGYTWALSQSSSVTLAAEGVVTTAAARPLITLWSASQTGNARRVAEQLQQQLQAQGWQVEHWRSGEVKTKTLAQLSVLLVVAATYGEGEPPEEALGLHKFLLSARAPKLEHLRYAVLGLGDSSYEHFCQTGKDFDRRLSELGAQPLLARVDADVDFAATASHWQQEVLAALAPLAAAAGASSSSAVTPVTVAVGAVYQRDNPCTVSLLARQKITGRNSSKDIQHIELDLAGTGLTYQPGDALGVWQHNDPALVAELLQLTGLPADALVTLDGQPLRLADALREKLELSQNAPTVVAAYAELSGDATLLALRDDKAALRAYAQRHSVPSMLATIPAALSAQQLVELLRRLTPRLYSIASSQAEVGEEVHLTVGVVRYAEGDKTRTGVASGYLGERLSEGDSLRVFVEPNDQFRLPSSPNAPVIMIGPGTGIAPFRAFMQQRAAEGAGGPNWLFFGNPHFTEDFLYQVEWQRWVKEGVVSRISLAWSRDQAQKIYVQDRLREQGAEIWQWLQQGAHLYVCGDASKMAHDVQQALLDIVAQHGGMDAAQSEAYLDELRAAQRYQRDVY